MLDYPTPITFLVVAMLALLSMQNNSAAMDTLATAIGHYAADDYHL